MNLGAILFSRWHETSEAGLCSWAAILVMFARRSKHSQLWKSSDNLRFSPEVVSNFSVPKQRKQPIQIQTFERTINDTSPIICSRKISLTLSRYIGIEARLNIINLKCLTPNKCKSCFPRRFNLLAECWANNKFILNLKQGKKYMGIRYTTYRNILISVFIFLRGRCIARFIQLTTLLDSKNMYIFLPDHKD